MRDHYSSPTLRSRRTPWWGRRPTCRCTSSGMMFMLITCTLVARASCSLLLPAAPNNASPSRRTRKFGFPTGCVFRRRTLCAECRAETAAGDEEERRDKNGVCTKQRSAIDQHPGSTLNVQGHSGESTQEIIPCREWCGALSSAHRPEHAAARQRLLATRGDGSANWSAGRWPSRGSLTTPSRCCQFLLHIWGVLHIGGTRKDSRIHIHTFYCGR